MFNFTYHNPTKIIFGKNKVKEINNEIPQDAKVLITYGGGSVEKTGTLSEVVESLGKRDVFKFGGIEPNPRYETLIKAVKIIEDESIDFILAVGGGSVIDGTKFIAAAALYEGDSWEIMTSMGSNIKSAIPFGTVLTLPATASEMNCGGVITKAATNTKIPFSNPLVYPKFSVLDPTKTFTLPERQISNGVVDSFVHIMEQYLTYPVNSEVQDRFSEGLLQSLIELGPKVLEDKENYDLRANLMWIATMGLNGLIGAGVPQDWASHMIGHELTALYGIDHGCSLAIVLPAVMKVQKSSKKDKILQYAERVLNITRGKDEERIELAISKTEDFFRSLNVKTKLSEYDLTSSSIDSVIGQLEAHGMTSLGEHGDVDLEKSRRILETCL